MIHEEELKNEGSEDGKIKDEHQEKIGFKADYLNDKIESHNIIKRSNNENNMVSEKSLELS